MMAAVAMAVAEAEIGLGAVLVAGADRGEPERLKMAQRRQGIFLSHPALAGRYEPDGPLCVKVGTSDYLTI